MTAIIWDGETLVSDRGVGFSGDANEDFSRTEVTKIVTFDNVSWNKDELLLRRFGQAQ